MSLAVVILAAGQGTRMKSSLPKVLHPVAGVPMLERVVRAAVRLDADKIVVVYGNGGEDVHRRLGHLDITWVLQAEQKGTGHAVAQAIPEVAGFDDVLILYGDVPCITTETLTKLRGAHINLLTADVKDPTGLGRIIRDSDGKVVAIVEHKDASDEQRAITEINSGILCTQAANLAAWLPKLEDNNAQGEYYLTDIIAMAVAEGKMVEATFADPNEVRGVNNRKELCVMERVAQQQIAEQLMSEGVSLLDPARFDVRGSVNAKRDVVIDVNVILEGDVELGEGVRIGPNCILRNAKIGDGCDIKANSIIEESVVEAGCVIGPFARIRPGCELKHGSKVGNFVEMKNTVLGVGSKANHLSYIGDAIVGVEVNIGAGTITCNYDGVNKHQTVIEDYAFIGSDTQLVAPVRVGTEAVIGAGSTITKDAPSGKLTVGRGRQMTVEGWERPKKK